MAPGYAPTAGPRLRIDLSTPPKVLLTLKAWGTQHEVDRPFQFDLTPGGEEAVRWYLEEALLFAHDPVPALAAQVEERMREVGRALGRALFDGHAAARSLWDAAAPELGDARVEVIAGPEVARLPWELLTGPAGGTAVALAARSFVRVHPGSDSPVESPDTPEAANARPVRILLVVSRPGGRADVPFRSVARRLLDVLDLSGSGVEVTALRPPSFGRLREVVEEAAAAGRPFDVIHFDGHGGFGETADDPRTGEHGFALFEGLAGDAPECVSGPALGEVLVEGGVSVFVLNACRSAHAAPHSEPSTDEAESLRDRVRAFGSLAQEVADAGVPGVVAMRYNVFVVTATQYVAELYRGLARGLTLGEASTRARSALSVSPALALQTAMAERPFADWSAPVVYESTPLRVVEATSQGKTTSQLHIESGPGWDSLPLPAVGVVGRDGVLLDLDRAFDRAGVAVVHGYAGAGKTTAAAEFTRWYAATGGVAPDAVAFSSFESHRPLASVVEDLLPALGPGASAVAWQTLSVEERVAAVFEVLGERRVLWVWDNVEGVMGFPAGAPSPWSSAEQRALADLLRRAEGTGLRVVLTSRRPERALAGNNAVDVPVGPLNGPERTVLARALVERSGGAFDAGAWGGVLEFSGGNPLTVEVVVGQALRSGLRTRDELSAFAERLRAGEAELEEDADEAHGRTRSLRAALRYGADQAFDDAERDLLALVGAFEGTADVGFLHRMAVAVMRQGPSPVEGDGAIRELAGIVERVLAKAAEVGLIRSLNLAGLPGMYALHPALRWFLSDLLVERHGGAEAPFVATAREFARWCVNNYNVGGGVADRVSVLLPLHERNLLRALGIALGRFEWDDIWGVAAGLQLLYRLDGREAAVRDLSDRIGSAMNTAEAGGAPAPSSSAWSFFAGLRVEALHTSNDYDEAITLQEELVQSKRRAASKALGALSKRPDRLKRGEREALAPLGVALERLGGLLRDKGDAVCGKPLEEALRIALCVDAKAVATCAMNLGHAYKDIEELRDLDRSEEMYELCLREAGAISLQAMAVGQLGRVSRVRLEQALQLGRPASEIERLAREALQRNTEAMRYLTSTNDLARARELRQRGRIFGLLHQIEEARVPYAEAIAIAEYAGDVRLAGLIKSDFAVDLFDAGLRGEAGQYLAAAMADFERVPGAEGKLRRSELSRIRSTIVGSWQGQT